MPTQPSAAPEQARLIRKSQHTLAMFEDGVEGGQIILQPNIDEPATDAAFNVYQDRLEWWSERLSALRIPAQSPLICSGCGSKQSDVIKMVVDGHAACCPDCSVLSVDARNELREALANLKPA
jgi:hypothetical protein